MRAKLVRFDHQLAVGSWRWRRQSLHPCEHAADLLACIFTLCDILALLT